MRNDQGDSRGFGFVSYHQPEHGGPNRCRLFCQKLNLLNSR